MPPKRVLGAVEGLLVSPCGPDAPTVPLAPYPAAAAALAREFAPACATAGLACVAGAAIGGGAGGGGGILGEGARNDMIISSYDTWF